MNGVQAVIFGGSAMILLALALRLFLKKHLPHRVFPALWCLCALRLLLLAMYWFDPFVWLAARLSKIDCELACDDLALRDLQDSARIAYGRTLLDQISIKRAPMQAALCATTMVSGKKTLRARIRLIAKKPKMTAVTLILVVGVCLLLAACTFT